jgi:hypothetical protein
MFGPRDGWKLFFLTTLHAFILLRPGWRFWYWPRIVVTAWKA